MLIRRCNERDPTRGPSPHGLIHISHSLITVFTCEKGFGSTDADLGCHFRPANTRCWTNVVLMLADAEDGGRTLKQHWVDTCCWLISDTLTLSKARHVRIRRLELIPARKKQNITECRPITSVFKEAESVNWDIYNDLKLKKKHIYSPWFIHKYLKGYFRSSLPGRIMNCTLVGYLNLPHYAVILMYR